MVVQGDLANLSTRAVPIIPLPAGVEWLFSSSLVRICQQGKGEPTLPAMSRKRHTTETRAVRALNRFSRYIQRKRIEILERHLDKFDPTLPECWAEKRSVSERDVDLARASLSSESKAQNATPVIFVYGLVHPWHPSTQGSIAMDTPDQADSAKNNDAVAKAWDWIQTCWSGRVI